MVERVSTGVPGLNDFLEGGFPENSVTLITGGAGAGKTTFCTQYIHEGLENDEKCLYLSTGQSSEEIRRDAKNFEINFDNYIENLSMAQINPSREFESEVLEKIKDEEFDRIVLDSLSVFEMHWGDQAGMRKYLNKLVEHLKQIEATAVVTSERPSDSSKLTRFGIAEFIVDGVIKLEGYSLGEKTYRSAQIVKMRRTPIEGQVLKATINDDGLSVGKEEKI